MRWLPLSIVLALCLTVAALPAASATSVTVDTTDKASCVGPWTTEYSVGVGPASVTVITCDPFLGEPPW